MDIIGFQRCHVFDNESSVDIKTECQKYGERVTYELVKGWPNQYALYNRYINNESPAWWVLPIDDDEFLYVSKRYGHRVNNCILDTTLKHPDWCKVCVGWRNLFPEKFTEERVNPHLVLNATAWSNEASEIWQCGNRPVKTFVHLAYHYDWADRNNQHRTHNPFVIGCDKPGYTLNNEAIVGSWQVKPTIGNEDLILYHYQFKCNTEWKMKCENRKSPGAISFNKNFPQLYTKLYTHNELSIDSRAFLLWN